MFRIYDDDDAGVISYENLMRCAEDLGEDVNKEQLETMIDMGDKGAKKKGGVDSESFMELMKSFNLI